MDHKEPGKERWGSRLGLILVVASGAIGLGNFLRFPGQAVKNGGGAFMIPYIISFFLLGIPVCMSEWIMGRIGGKHGHSSLNIFRTYLDGIPLRFVSTLGIIIPLLIYVYYVFIEAWCLTYTIDFLIGSINLHPMNLDRNDATYIDTVVSNAGNYFLNLTGAKESGSGFRTTILPYTLLCFAINFFVVFLGISRGLESLAKISVPLMVFCAITILIRVLTLDGIGKGLGKMWNPDWSALLNGDVWIAAAGQIFFSLSVGFGIVLSFSSYLTEKDDVTLSGITAASLNEFIEVAFGGMITIPVGFLFLGAMVASYGTFGMGFIALPAVFSLMPAGNLFGAIWFLVLFLAALTSSVTMIQPGIIFLEEAFKMKRKRAILFLFLFTISLTLLIIYFNKDFTALDHTDFWIGTFCIYILATIQILIYGWKITPEMGRMESSKGSLLEIPKIFDFVIKYITPTFLITIFVIWAYQSLPDYINKMNSDYMVELARKNHTSEVDAIEKAHIAKGVFVSIIGIFIFIFYLVNIGLENIMKKEKNIR